MKHLFVLLSPAGDQVGPYALALAKDFNAQITAFAYAFEPSLAYFVTDSPVDVVAQAREAAADVVAGRLSEFDRNAKQTGLTVASKGVVASAGRIACDVARLARSHDLTVLQAYQEHALEHSLLSATLFGSGRPILAVPNGNRALAHKNLLIAWDGGAPAARAIADALPLLQRARTVRLVSVSTTHHPMIQTDQVPMIEHLALHGIRAEASILTGVDTNTVLLSYLAELGPDLVIMGGYGHSRFREFVLGGTTRDLLAAATAPLFMAH